ncbi:prolactin-releasing peptide receptor-like [Narcine bancroftii]|uniref:prolactin-releasing peptide receptor-like n=1 Tax=Narcine bancroftii TaxID=1343680 RepID=UPI003831C732
MSVSSGSGFKREFCSRWDGSATHKRARETQQITEHPWEVKGNQRFGPESFVKVWAKDRQVPESTPMAWHVLNLPPLVQTPYRQRGGRSLAPISGTVMVESAASRTGVRVPRCEEFVLRAADSTISVPAIGPESRVQVPRFPWSLSDGLCSQGGETMEAVSAGNASVANRSSLTIFAGTDLLQRYKPFFLLLYCALVLVACVGNSFLIGCIAADRKLHNATNFFIGNLSAADLLMCLSCVPLTVSYAFEPRGWLFGGFMCHLASLLQSATVYVSVLSLAAIAVDRYMVVAHPVRRRITVGSCGLVVAAIWLLSVGMAAPASANVRYLELKQTGSDVNICEEFWRGMERERLVYSCLVMLVSYMVPLGAVTASYCAITIHLRKRNVPEAGNQSQAMWNRRKRKTFLLLVISATTFAGCWLPLQVLNLMRDLDVDFEIIDVRYLNLAQVACHWVAMSSSCYNPFIYASLHHKVRHRLRVQLRHWDRKVPPAAPDPVARPRLAGQAGPPLLPSMSFS